MKSLEDILSYRHPEVIKRFAKDHPQMGENAPQIFEDLMRFFWASHLHEEARHKDPHNPDLNFLYIMDEEMRGIDIMWHTFLLYTQDYMDFCDKYFGKYIHHLPDIVDKMEDDVAKFEENLEKFLSFTYDTLGETVIRRWYADYV